MNGRDNISIYKIWSSQNNRWAAWCKPVVFAQMPFFVKEELDFSQVNPAIDFLQIPHSAVIFDIPGETGTLEALSLISEGYMPVPLFNCVSTNEAIKSVINVASLQRLLFLGTDLLVKTHVENLLKPAFILDSNRMNPYHLSTTPIYDNRWCVFPQDLPSGAYLLKHGIKNIIVKTDFIKDDLHHILRRFQEAGLQIYHQELNNQCKLIKIAKHNRSMSFSRRFFMMLGLSRNMAGGFGTKKVQSTYTSMHG